MFSYFSAHCDRNILVSLFCVIITVTFLATKRNALTSRLKDESGIWKPVCVSCEVRGNTRRKATVSASIWCTNNCAGLGCTFFPLTLRIRSGSIIIRWENSITQPQIWEIKNKDGIDKHGLLNWRTKPGPVYMGMEHCWHLSAAVECSYWFTDYLYICTLVKWFHTAEFFTVDPLLNFKILNVTLNVTRCRWGKQKNFIINIICTVLDLILHCRPV